MARTSAAARPLTDHEQIRAWAEQRGAQPSCVRRTGGKGDVGMIRLDFPGFSGEGSLQPISWDEWFQKFDESNLALLVQEHTAGGEQSNFNKLVSRETAEANEEGKPSDQSRSRRRQSRSNGRGRSRSASSQTQTARGRNKRTTARGTSSQSRSSRGANKRRAARGTSTQSRSARGRKASAARKSVGKKAPARSQTSRSSSSRRRAA